ncbi:MAG: two-component system response regulator HydG [Kiritimatiellia bacterium]|jgi:two-component system response regulator HydG
MPSLVITNSQHPEFGFTLHAGRTIIGRSDACDLALPSDTVSRTHCIIERRVEGWWLIDRSRNGTTANGQPIRRHLLSDGDQIGVGEFVARFSKGTDGEQRTTARATALPSWEELVGADASGVTRLLAIVRMSRGPHKNTEFVLQSPRTWLGGPGADIEVDRDLAARAVGLRVTRGRVMVEPTMAVPVKLANHLVNELTPMLDGEEVRFGEHGFVVLVQTRHEEPEKDSFGAMVGSTQAMHRLFGVLHRVAQHDITVLLTGESGTGKELAARGIHDVSPRGGGAFVAINCAALPDTLFESELFGHEKGAFTGAAKRSDGAFHRAQGGTLFLDEVGELPLDQQAKLLRVLETGEVRRVGGERPEFPNVRIVAATNRALPEMVAQGSFRQDLFFRLNTLPVRLPPLRERPADIPVLVRRLLDNIAPETNVSPGAMRRLQAHPWPGNVRELRNVLQRACVLHGPNLIASHLVFSEDTFAVNSLPVLTDNPERQQLVQALHDASGNRSQAARALGIPRSSLLYKMRKWRVQ